MKKALLFLSLSLVFITFSCKKDNSITSGSGSTKGKLTLISTTSDPYSIYIDGNYRCVIQGKNEKSFDLEEGAHTYRYHQQSGYIFYPTDETVSVIITKGATTIKRFPD